MAAQERAAVDQIPEAVCHRVDELQDLTGIPRTTLYRHISEGRLKARRDGRRILIEHDELIRFVESLPMVVEESGS